MTTLLHYIKMETTTFSCFDWQKYVFETVILKVITEQEERRSRFHNNRVSR